MSDNRSEKPLLAEEIDGFRSELSTRLETSIGPTRTEVVVTTCGRLPVSRQVLPKNG